MNPFTYLFENWNERVEGRRVDSNTRHADPIHDATHDESIHDESVQWTSADDLLVYCSLMVMDRALSQSGYPREQVRKMRERMRAIAKLFDPRREDHD